MKWTPLLEVDDNSFIASALYLKDNDKVIFQVQYLRTMKMSSLKKQSLAFLFILSLAIVEQTEANLSKWHIHVVNGLSNNDVLYVRCRSKDDNLGEHNLNVGGEFKWTFRVNFWNTTLFWCFLQKPNGQKQSFETFWVEKRTFWLYHNCFENECFWIAKDDGIYLKENSTNTDILVHRWE